MDRPGKESLSRAACPFDQHGAAALGDPREYIEEARHGRASADDILKTVACPELLLQFLHLTQVLKGLDTADYPVFVIFQQGCGDADGHALTVMIDDVGHGVSNRFSVRHGAAQHAGVLADAGVKNVHAAPSYRLAARYPGNKLGRSIEGGDTPLSIDREDPLVDRIENDVPDLRAVHALSLPRSAISVNGENCIVHCLIGCDTCFLQYSYYGLFQKTVTMRISVLTRMINGPAGKGKRPGKDYAREGGQPVNSDYQQCRNLA